MSIYNKRRGLINARSRSSNFDDSENEANNYHADKQLDSLLHLNTELGAWPKISQSYNSEKTTFEVIDVGTKQNTWKGNMPFATEIQSNFNMQTIARWITKR